MRRRPKTHLVISTTSLQIEHLGAIRVAERAAVEHWGRAGFGWIADVFRGVPGPKSARELDRIVEAMAALGDGFPGGHPHKYWQERFGAKDRHYFRALREYEKSR